MEPARSVLMSGSGAESLLELAFTDALEQTEYDDEMTRRLLDAAYEQFRRLGIRRSTMEDVARRAGVSRVTAYRRFSTKDALVEHVVRREFRRYFDQFLVDIREAETAADRVVVGFASALQAIRSNPLIGGLMSAEPELVIPSMVSDDGRTLATVQRFIAGQLRREQEAGTVGADVDVELVAEMMTRVCTSFLVTPSLVVDLDDDEQVRNIAREFLVPMLKSPQAPGRGGTRKARPAKG